MSVADPTGMSHIVLRKYYAHIGSLKQYLRAITDLEDFTFIDNNKKLTALVSSITVASQNPWETFTRHHAEPAQTDLSEIIDLAQHRIFSRPGPRENVLTYGYRKSTYRSSNGGKIDSVRSHKLAWVNTNVTFLSSPIWGRILDSIGDGAMMDLLTVPSLFIDVGNNCLSQLTGSSISELDPPSRSKRRAEETPQESSLKRARTDTIATLASRKTPGAKRVPQGLAPKKGAAGIHIQRIAAFYARPRRRPNGRVYVGLPKYHVLNFYMLENKKDADNGGPPKSQRNPPPRTKGATTSSSGVFRSEKEMEMEKICRHISKHVFPREYGLPNIFLSGNPREKFTFQAKESHIKRLGNCKTPKRVKQSLSLFQKLVKLHAAYDYAGWCGRICPSKLKTPLPRPEPDGIDESLLMNTMSYPHTQIPPSTLDVSHDSQVVPHGASQAKAECKNKPRFVDFAHSHSQVFRYVIHCVKAVIPRAFWGSDHNFRITCLNIRRLIQARRHEHLSLHEVLQGFKINDCELWIGTASERAKQQRSSVSDSIKRRELLEEFIYWFFESFVLSLIRTTFYVTESSAFKNHVLYFRQDDWDALSRPLVDTLASKTFRKIAMAETEVQEILKERRLSYSFVRLLPKETGVRPIVNLRRTGPGGKSINQLLLAAFQILNYEKLKQPDLLGAAVFSHNEMFKRIKVFKNYLSGGDQNHQLPNLYFVKVDVRACFDTIDQTKLLEILRSLIRRDKYVMVKHGQITPKMGQTKRTFERKACGTNDHVLFMHYARQLAENLRNVVFVDKVIYDKESRKEILELLEEHITENVVKIGKSYYKQMVGIPQGSILSSLLCSFFYGDLEEKRMRWHKDPDCLMLRWIDDYLFITSDKGKALSFLDSMSEGHPDYGCFISTEKTLTNFWCDKHQPNLVAADAQGFQWCGLLIDMKNLNVTADYSRYSGQHIADFLTVVTNRHAGSAFEYKMAKMVKQRSHPIFTDANFNSMKVAHLNVFHNYILTAMKMHHYIKAWGVNVNKQHRFIWGVLQRSLRYCARTISNYEPSTTGSPKRARIGMTATHWLGLYAFNEILGRKPTAYTSLLQDIRLAMRSPLYERTCRRLESLVKRHAHDLDSIKW